MQLKQYLQTSLTDIPLARALPLLPRILSPATLPAKAIHQCVVLTRSVHEDWTPLELGLTASRGL